MRRTFPIHKFQNLETPFYFYDTALLDQTLSDIHRQTESHPAFQVHFAVKACTNPKVLRHIVQAGLGADCVSGGEIQTCLDAGFPAHKIVFAGVGKADWEIRLALQAGIGIFNVESEPELEVINELAGQLQCQAAVCFRVNPDVEAHTHSHITTGRAENKFGIAMEDLEGIIDRANAMEHVSFVGLHFHIGSQILQMDDFIALCQRVNELQDRLEKQGRPTMKHINVGGGLGIDYADPDAHPIPDFQSYFQTYAHYLTLRSGQQLHFELGRALVGQCGSLITRCLYVKQGSAKRFVIVDAGMTELIRPALYGALHPIQNLSSEGPEQSYDIVGPICESSDTFATDYPLAETRRGDLLAIRSAGAYGETMASQYNCRRLPASYTTEDLI